ncbi:MULTISPECIES: TonB-dependent receptor family protein [unclassified Pseudomonas]|uniref:TonB-dependent receptor family protein n=1 Tax=unclassified Pseudomonas TaxID=196821 RepID=UPI0021C6B03F|nr:MULTISPECIES: TonB-dependent receptor [unclassified Pseudomonas]MCU1731738.1 TonB-dependent receptor [Pseudomonas sp. 20P_3.2_Bac4]MCU1743794.1 TonB-dependent receptor [Pseudomonas sp. 20P_3.2_Bac5]
MPSPLSLHSSLYLLGLSLAGGTAVQAADTVELGQVVIQEKQQDELHAAQERLREVPGGTNLVDMSRVEQGRVASNQDVLAYQPGVFAQSAGNDGIKLSIRGSGINRAPGAHGSGTYVMFDGLPLTGPGGTPYELFEPLWLSRAEVLRGANGFDHGALALGGAINYVTRTGHDAAPLQLRYEAGSRGYMKRQISSGQVLGDLDYYVALTDSEYDGYQDHSSGSSKGIAANVGYRFNPNLETRFYLRYRETDNELAGRVTQDQIKHHPRAANPAYLTRDDSRPQPGSTWLGNKTTFYLDDDSQLEAGLVYHDYPMDLREGPMRLKVAYTDVSGTLNYQRRHTLFGHESKTTIGWRTTKHLPNSGASQYTRLNGVFGAKTRDFTYQGSDTVLHVGNELELIPDLWLTSGLAAIYTRRESDVTFPVSGGKVSQHDWDYAPRLGLRYDLSPALQLYGNLSRSVEPPHPWSLIWSAPTQTQPIEMQNQTATTLELGARGDSDLGRWDLAWYYAKVRHELLAVETQAATQATAAIVGEFNASPTTHQGVEASLDSPLWERAAVGKLSLRQAYTFSDFHYRDDKVFGDNRLPGIPMHYYQAELRFDLPSGFYAGLNTQMASKVQVDYANSYNADAYALLGATLGYNAPKQDWQTWLDLRNLTNKRYAAIVVPGYNDRGADVARSVPGEGFGVYAGISYSFR